MLFWIFKHITGKSEIAFSERAKQLGLLVENIYWIQSTIANRDRAAAIDRTIVSAL